MKRETYREEERVSDSKNRVEEVEKTGNRHDHHRSKQRATYNYNSIITRHIDIDNIAENTVQRMERRKIKRSYPGRPCYGAWHLMRQQ